MIQPRVFRTRVLVRVINVQRTTLKVCVPGWNSRSFFKVPKKLFPKFRFQRGYRFHAHANMAAERVADLDLGGPAEEGSTRVPTLASLVTQRPKADRPLTPEDFAPSFARTAAMENL